MSAWLYAMLRSSLSAPASTRFSAAAAASALKVEHIGKRSSTRWARPSAPLASTTATPSRPPAAASIAATRAAAGDSSARAQGAASAAARPARTARRVAAKGIVGSLGVAQQACRIARPLSSSGGRANGDGTAPFASSLLRPTSGTPRRDGPRQVRGRRRYVWRGRSCENRASSWERHRDPRSPRVFANPPAATRLWRPGEAVAGRARHDAARRLAIRRRPSGSLQPPPSGIAKAVPRDGQRRLTRPARRRRPRSTSGLAALRAQAWARGRARARRGRRLRSRQRRGRSRRPTSA